MLTVSYLINDEIMASLHSRNAMLSYGPEYKAAALQEENQMNTRQHISLDTTTVLSTYLEDSIDEGVESVNEKRN